MMTTSLWISLSGRAFHKALETMELSRNQIEHLEHASGKSLTVLRRRLAKSPAIRFPHWSTSEEFARMLCSMMLAGTWKIDNRADRYLMCELAGCNDYEELELGFTRMLNLEDSPVWSIGGFRGVVSKIDALYAVHKWVTAEQISRFMTVSEMVLSERDPSLDLPEHQQWAALLYGKVREISSPLSRGVAESLVLLAIHGDKLFRNRLQQNLEHMVAELVGNLLEPMTAEKLQSQSSKPNTIR